MPEDDVRVIAAQILLVLDYMNRLKIVHRDLKPENILLNSRKEKDFDIRIADFGYATKVKKANRDKSQKLDSGDSCSALSDTEMDEKLVCGTAGYIPPEAIIGGGYNPKSDIFSFGSILFSILTLRNLFPAQD